MSIKDAILTTQPTSFWPLGAGAWEPQTAGKDAIVRGLTDPATLLMANRQPSTEPAGGW